MAGTGRPRGRPPLTAQRAQWAVLIAQGVSNREACRRVGVDRSSGRHWRNGDTARDAIGRVRHYPPVKIIEPKARSDRYLSEEERVQIADLRGEGLGVREIARRIGRCASTVSRELSRNGGEDGSYRPHGAQRLAGGRLGRARQRRVATDTVLHDTVLGLLGRRFSPEQVSHELHTRFPGERARQLCTESIYQAIYDPLVDITRPCRRRRRKRRLRPDQRRQRPESMRMITERPSEVESRDVAGHWEGDLIKGAYNRSAIGTLVERKTRFVVLLHLDGGQGAQALNTALEHKLAVLPEALRRSLTWDQGTEMAGHEQLSASTGTSVFFCEAHSPWQRASNENMNGVLRDYFPKGSDLSQHGPQELERVAAEINARPRRTLGWHTPAQLLDMELEQLAA
ncbi:IS30 family transposase [Conexibacter sp. S30A1]|uniref:IS30 family transposase n=1 Tax=Conexibacter sp. S30A1 TaxID=2937800 RepID=UPI002010090B|nr:IS30 family transposase [Conexibacter sp. S30A1]